MLRRIIKAWDVLTKHNIKPKLVGNNLIFIDTIGLSGNDAGTLYSAGWSSSYRSGEPIIWYKKVSWYKRCIRQGKNGIN